MTTPIWLKGYFAGLCDGEGTVTIMRVKTRYKTPEYRAVVSIANTVTEPLMLLQTHYGGTFCLLRRKQPARYKPIYVWLVSCRKASIFLKDVFPYLIIKKRNAELALDLQDGISTTGKRISSAEIQRREALHQAIRKRKEIYEPNSNMGRETEILP